MKHHLRQYDEVIENVIINAEDQTIEIIRRTPSNVRYATFPSQRQPDLIEKLIYHVKDGLIVLKETKKAKIIPAREESYTFE